MDRYEKLLNKMMKSPQNVRFDDLKKLCNHHFGNPRNKGTSHHIYKMPWKGDPRIIIQKGKNGKAKLYQVKQAIDAILKKIK